MVRIVRVAATIALCSVGAGLAMGNATVAAMQVRRAPAGAAPDVRPAQFDLGRAWAASHQPEGGDACPRPTLWFQMGCVTGTLN